MALCELSRRAKKGAPVVCQPLTMIQAPLFTECVLCPLQGKLPCKVREAALAARGSDGARTEYKFDDGVAILGAKHEMARSGVVWKKVQI